MAGEYYRRDRPAIQHAVGKLAAGARVLDVGCGAGHLGEALKTSWGARTVTGVELDAGAAEEAERHLDRVLQGDVESLTLEFAPGEFDLILFADLLEHLVDPWRFLRRATGWMIPGGHVCVSVPNVRQLRVLLDLAVRDRWRYRDSGILDRTHLRFFTRSTARDLVRGAGLELLWCRPMLTGRPRWASRLTAGALDAFLTHQWLLLGRKPGHEDHRDLAG